MQRRTVFQWSRRACAALFMVFVLAPGRSVAADDFAASMDAAMARMDRDMMVWQIDPKLPG